MTSKQAIITTLCATLLLSGSIRAYAQKDSLVSDSVETNRIEIQSRIQSMKTRQGRYTCHSALCPPTKRTTR